MADSGHKKTGAAIHRVTMSPVKRKRDRADAEMAANAFRARLPRPDPGHNQKNNTLAAGHLTYGGGDDDPSAQHFRPHLLVLRKCVRPPGDNGFSGRYSDTAAGPRDSTTLPFSFRNAETSIGDVFTCHGPIPYHASAECKHPRQNDQREHTGAEPPPAVEALGSVTHSKRCTPREPPARATSIPREGLHGRPTMVTSHRRSRLRHHQNGRRSHCPHTQPC